MWESGFLGGDYLFLGFIKLVWILFFPLIAVYCYFRAKHSDGILWLFFNVLAIFTVIHGVIYMIQAPEMLWVGIPAGIIAIVTIVLMQGEEPDLQ